MIVLNNEFLKIQKRYFNFCNSKILNYFLNFYLINLNLIYKILNIISQIIFVKFKFFKLKTLNDSL